MYLLMSPSSILVLVFTFCIVQNAKRSLYILGNKQKQYSNPTSTVNDVFAVGLHSSEIDNL